MTLDYDLGHSLSATGIKRGLGPKDHLLPVRADSELVVTGSLQTGAVNTGDDDKIGKGDDIEL